MTSQRLPTPGGDNGTWGDILNDFLEVEHNTDGTLRSAVKTINSKTPTNGAVTLTASDVSAVSTSQLGAANGVAQLDGTSKLTSAQIPDLSSTYVPIPAGGSDGSVLRKNSAAPNGIDEWAPAATIDTTDLPHALGAASAGTSTSASAADHVHPMPIFVDSADLPQPLGTAAHGASTLGSPADHVHAMPSVNTLVGANISEQVTSSEITLPRSLSGTDSGSISQTPASGVVGLTYFVARAATVVGHITFSVGGTAASGATHAYVGLYSVNASTGTLTRTALSADQGATGFPYTYNKTVIALTSSVTLTAGATYAVATLQIGATSASMYGAYAQSEAFGLTPRLTGELAAQSSLPSSITDASLATTTFALFAICGA
ncbi:MAG: hypothetical protein WDN27_04295 [Candidatus Saccharibacteria bacterium]